MAEEALLGSCLEKSLPEKCLHQWKCAWAVFNPSEESCVQLFWMSWWWGRLHHTHPYWLTGMGARLSKRSAAMQRSQQADTFFQRAQHTKCFSQREALLGKNLTQREGGGEWRAWTFLLSLWECNCTGEGCTQTLLGLSVSRTALCETTAISESENVCT